MHSLFEKKMYNLFIKGNLCFMVSVWKLTVFGVQNSDKMINETE